MGVFSEARQILDCFRADMQTKAVWFGRVDMESHFLTEEHEEMLRGLFNKNSEETKGSVPGAADLAEIASTANKLLLERTPDKYQAPYTPQHFEERPVPLELQNLNVQRVWRLKRDHRARYFLWKGQVYYARTTRLHTLTREELEEATFGLINSPLEEGE